jgi:aminopeptidase N
MAKSELYRYHQLNQLAQKRTVDENIDLVYAKLALEPDMNTGAIVSASVGFTFRTLSSISALSFDLRKELSVDSIVYHGSSIAYLHGANHILNISLPNALPQNTLDSIRIYYHGKPNMGTRAYSRSVNASGANISTLSQPYGAPYWWPCRDNLKDKIDSLDVLLTVDTPYTAVSNGVLQNVLNEGGKRTFSFKHRYPIANYLVAVSFSKYNTYTQKAFLSSTQKDLDIVNYVFPHNKLNEVQAQTFETIKMIRLFDSLFGTYPFHKEQYGHAQFAWGGGMEHQTMSFMVNFNYDLIAHELAHQWFGDKITCGTWKDIWLNEGFATYGNLLCYDFLGTKKQWLDVLKKTQEDVMSLPFGSVYANDTADVNKLFDYRTTYQKGAMVLHQLRWLIGDSAFFQAIRLYLADQNLAYNFVKQKTLQTYFESSSNQNLNDYFKDWIYGEGYPNYQIVWQQKGKQFEMRIQQTSSFSQIDTFNVPLPILLKGSKRDTFLRIDIKSLNQVNTLALDFKVKELVFDPQHWLLAKAQILFPKDNNDLISIYPNPFNGSIYISAREIQISYFEISDLTGRQVLRMDYQNAIEEGGILKIDLGNLADGIYNLKFGNAESSIHQKIIKLIN